MIYLFDLDHTLIRTSRIKTNLKESLVGLGIDPELFDNTYEEASKAAETHYGYDPARHADLIAHELGDPNRSAAITEAFLGTGIMDGCVYPDVATALETLRSRGHELWIITRGYENWQRHKLVATGLASHFANIIISPLPKTQKIQEIMKTTDRDTIFVTDNAVEIASITSHPRLRVIQIIRPDGKYTDRAPHIHQIQTLEELL